MNTEERMKAAPLRLRASAVNSAYNPRMIINENTEAIMGLEE